MNLLSVSQSMVSGGLLFIIHCCTRVHISLFLPLCDSSSMCLGVILTIVAIDRNTSILRMYNYISILNNNYGLIIL